MSKTVRPHLPMRKSLSIVGLILFASAPVFAKDLQSISYRVVEKIAGPDGGWDLLSVDPATERLYVARSNGVMAIDLKSGKVSPDVAVSNRGHDAMSIPGTSTVISTNGGANTATLFNGLTGEVIATLPVGTKPDAVAWDPATKTAWVMTPGSGDISVIDPSSAKVVATIAVGGSLELGTADGKGRLYVNVEDKNEVVVLDTLARKVIARFPLKGCDEPTGIAYAADTKQIVSACANGVAIVSAPNGRLVASLKVGTGPDGAVYDARRHLAFVPSGGDGTLSIVRLGAKPAVVGLVVTAKGARTVALDPSTGRLYLPSAQYLPANGARRPPMVPGSFKVLVVAPSQSL
ncbi:YncE family protein [Sphingomonas sp. SUN039]|uniref:YncE family protein n=1 Tax=Sphingomonas sp. SUN039 TaxID=2937787 RepID=UPI0021644963|nr:YncE family protein [Sphingomonas sp. SUN039]UVO53745.1 YncE family protein [Sphingomonas sp. SUN039]